MCQSARPAHGDILFYFDLYYYTQCTLSAIHIDTPDAYETLILQDVSGFCPDILK